MLRILALIPGPAPAAFYGGEAQTPDPPGRQKAVSPRNDSSSTRVSASPIHLNARRDGARLPLPRDPRAVIVGALKTWTPPHNKEECGYTLNPCVRSTSRSSWEAPRC